MDGFSFNLELLKALLKNCFIFFSSDFYIVFCSVLPLKSFKIAVRQKTLQ